MKLNKLLLTVLTAAALFSAAAYSFTAEAGKLKVKDQSVVNLRAGINSENFGVKKSSIYFAGKYKINEVVADLSQKLFEEKDQGMQILIARSLYEIGNNKGMNSVKSFAQKTENQKVKNILLQLYTSYAVQGGRNN
jgi:hypothetical protein